MLNINNIYTNWGKNISIKKKVINPRTLKEIKKNLSKKSCIVSGNLRSFNDSVFNNQTIINLKNFNKIKYFDTKKGVIDLECGILLSDFLKKIIKEGWFIPVTPGTKYVTVGGMIANNIHGKNLKNNQFRHYIKELKIINNKKKIITCNKKKNKKLFETTIGGFGLTGIILSAKIYLKKINSVYIDQKIIKFNSLSDLLNKLKTNSNYEYNVNWVQKIKENSIKGLMYFGKHSEPDKTNNIELNFPDKKMNFLQNILLKFFTQKQYFLNILNLLYKIFTLWSYKKKILFYDFFYPQDKLKDFNKIYKNGFFQIQFLTKSKDLIMITNKLKKFFEMNNLHSTFIILKTFNEKGENLDFFNKGISISLDVPILKNKKEIIKSFFNNLVTKHNLNINFSKDSILSKQTASKNKNYLKFKKKINNFNANKKFNSFFSQRLGIS